MTQTPIQATLGTPPTDPAGFRTQERALILMNLVVLAGMVGHHWLFRQVAGHLGALTYGLLGLRIVLLMVEFAWLQRAETFSPRAIVLYGRASVLVNLLFVALLGLLHAGNDSHTFIVLLVMPVVTAAFRLPLIELVGTVGMAAGVTMGLVWVVPAGSTVDLQMEQMESSAIALMLVIVALVVRLTAAQLWIKEQALLASLVDLRETRDVLIQQEKMAAVGRLAGAIAHEIRNPIAMIQSSIAAARSGNRGLSPELLEILHEESDRLKRLAGDFLGYARVRQPERRPVEVGTVLGSAVALAQARAEEVGVRLELHDLPAPPRMLDPFIVQQATLNLIQNALEAAPAGGRVVVAAGTDGRMVSIRVRNPGAPLPEEVVRRIGEPFFTTKPRGTGLGMAITRNLAESHGGGLQLTRNGPDWVEFELRLDAPEAP